jgi:hypothetical protein
VSQIIRVILTGALLSCAPALEAATVTFDTLADGDLVTTQYPGLTFSNTVVLTAGISLNEFELPPRSGSNVASDSGGPITIDFLTPVTSFSAYFTYLAPLTVTGFNSSSAAIASASSAFGSNLALSGDPGSSPNELLMVAAPSGISRVTILGDPGGGSFTMDDAAFTPLGGTTVPEPATGTLALCVVLLLGIARWAGVLRGVCERRPLAGAASDVRARRFGSLLRSDRAATPRLVERSRPNAS